MTEPHDPFDELAAVTDEVVDPVFAARLRARVQRALGMAPDRITIGLPSRAATDTTKTAITADSRTERNTTMAQVITPYICVHDAAAALDWYREYFGAGVSNVIPWEGRVGHAELDVAGAVFYLSDEAPQLGVVAPTLDGSRTSVSIVIQVAAVEQFVERAERGGAVVQRPIEEAHGSRSAWIVDPFGHRWNVGTPVYDAEESAARRAPSEPYYMTLTSADVERGAAFYGAVLGWETVPQDNGGRHVVNTEMPIGLRATENPFGNTEPGQIEMWFTVRDFDDAVERVRVAGGTVVELNAWDSGREAICEDDQGVTFKLSEPAPGYER
ncbi:MAG: VOC family protein [Ilumatobacteraceae bacterium]